MKAPRIAEHSRIALLLIATTACMDDPARSVSTESKASTPTLRAVASVPPAASLSVRVTVPASMRTSPFNVDRFLTIPPNFAIAVYARIPGARFMAAAPNGDLLVSNPGASSIYLVRPSTSGGDPIVTTWASGLY
ncbi:MAG TPA: hypothetical protein VM939_02615, partial [Gemmatimonadaceae bacterium]|nr:hypothetical protein [Gemmatimonadaceae bacterium]